MNGRMYNVWIKMGDTNVTLDDIIKAGIVALGVDAQLDETEYLDGYED